MTVKKINGFMNYLIRSKLGRVAKEENPPKEKQEEKQPANLDMNKFIRGEKQDEKP